MKPAALKRIRPDSSLLLGGIFLIGLGLVQVYSSSYIFAVENYQDGLFFFRKQLIYVTAGLLVMVGAGILPAKLSLRVGTWIWILAVVGVAATLIPGVGVKVGGAVRWLKLPFGLRLEPGEFLRASFPFVAAWALEGGRTRKGETRSWALRSLIVMAPMALLILQPDFGSVVLTCLVGLTLVFVQGLSWAWVAAIGLTGFVAATGLVLAAPYRLARVQAFLDPWADPAEKGFQLIQSMLSFHAGGIWGQGIGQGQGKLFFLPEAHTDFTLAVLAEESGFIGFSVVLLAFGFVVYRGFQVAVRLHDERSRLIATGLTLTLAFSVLVNVGVVTGMLPTKGLTLPFLSYGGSSLVANSLILGWLIALTREVDLTRSRDVSKSSHREKSL